MKAAITLGIDRMEIDWGKNNFLHDHSSLFHSTCIKQIPLYYYDDDSEEILVDYKEGCSSKLSVVKKRLDLLGYDLKTIKNLFESAVQECSRYDNNIPVTFSSYYNLICDLDLSTIDTVSTELQYEIDGFSFGEYARKCIIPSLRISIDSSDMWALSAFLENLDPYITLRILAENPNNNDKEVVWNHYEAIEAQIIQQNQIIKELPVEKRILIVTEGKSDTNIIKRTISKLYSEIADFFEFIDMEENYPFTGVGNLYNFCEGLCKINIMNNVIVLFDNDTAGVEKYNKSNNLKKPETLITLKLPDLEELYDMKTTGPDGEMVGNINGIASSIECFLDFNSVDRETIIELKAYNSQQYQGALKQKDAYVKAFFKYDLSHDEYDTSKLKTLIDYMIEKWINRMYPHSNEERSNN